MSALSIFWALYLATCVFMFIRWTLDKNKPNSFFGEIYEKKNLSVLSVAVTCLFSPLIIFLSVVVSSIEMLRGNSGRPSSGAKRKGGPQSIEPPRIKGEHETPLGDETNKLHDYLDSIESLLVSNGLSEESLVLMYRNKNLILASHEIGIPAESVVVTICTIESVGLGVRKNDA